MSKVCKKADLAYSGEVLADMCVCCFAVICQLKLSGVDNMKRTVVIVGGGLSGIIAAYKLAHVKKADIVLLDKGSYYTDRSQSNPKDQLFGFGGAGTLAGGKLCFPPASGEIWKKTCATSDALRLLFDSYLPPKHRYPDRTPTSIEADFSNSFFQKKYNTSLLLQDEMQMWIAELLLGLSELGVVTRGHCEVTNITQSNNSGYEVLFSNDSGKQERIFSDYIVLATGRTSTPLLSRTLEAKHIGKVLPDLGLRLSIKYSDGNPVFSTGADTKLKQLYKDLLVRTFCVCCGGDSALISNDSFTYYDGHFGRSITSTNNFGILARSYKLSGNEIISSYMSTLQKYIGADISLAEFLRAPTKYVSNTIFESLFETIANFVTVLYSMGAFEQSLSEIPVLLPSADHFNPIIHTNEYFEVPHTNIYVTGDASGVSRGFIQAMWSGLCAATNIEEKMCFGKQIVSA